MIMGSPSQTRRQRGYAWEKTIVKRFQDADDWEAVRLGSPSVSLPDVMAINSFHSIVYAIEAKSGAGNTLYVPRDQILRCLDWAAMFERYFCREFILAFKFMGKRRLRDSSYTSRPIKEYFWGGDPDWSLQFRSSVLDSIACTYEGRTYGIIQGERADVPGVTDALVKPTMNPADKTAVMHSVGAGGRF